VAQFQASGALPMGIACRLRGGACGIISGTPVKSSTLSRRWNCKLGFAHIPQNRGIQLQLRDCRDLHPRLRKPHLLFPRILTQAPISASSKPSISATGSNLVKHLKEFHYCLFRRGVIIIPASSFSRELQTLCAISQRCDHAVFMSS